jgi:flagellar hook-associated protein 2
MAGMSVDGLVSGLSTSDLISQLMQVESAPKTKVEQRITTQNTVQTALQSVNTRVKAIFTAADSLTSATGFDLTKATSSSDAVTASATGAAATGQLTFAVTALAKAQVSTAAFATAGTPAVADIVAGVNITINGGTPVNVTVAADKNTPQGLAEAINLLGLNVRAAAVDTGTPAGTVLQFTSTKTGLANSFDVTGLAGTLKSASLAADATIQVGSGAGAYSVASNTNSFSNLLPGVTLAVTKLAPEVSVSVTRDTDGIANKVSAMIDAANAALADMALKSDPKTKSSPLKGDNVVRQTTSAILGAVGGGYATTVGGVTSYGSYNTIGVQTDKSGRLTFDRDKFIAALNSDPAKTQSMIKDGLAATMRTVADGVTNVTTGSITQVLKTGEATIARLNTEITSWDARLAVRQSALQKQFTGLEVAMSKMKSQSSWLSGQLAALG